MFRVFLFLSLVNCGLAWAMPSDGDGYTVHSLAPPNNPKGRSDTTEMWSPHQDNSACLIHTIPASLRHYTFKQRMHRFWTGQLPMLEGTGTVTDNGILTVAHLLVREHTTTFLRRKVFAIYKPMEIFQGITLDDSGKMTGAAAWCEGKTKHNASARVSVDFVVKRDFLGDVQVVDFKDHDLALVSGTGMQDFSALVIPDIEVHKRKEGLTLAKCYHYPKGEPLQKHSRGHVALNSSCSQLPLVHHDLVSIDGSSGAGIRDEEERIFAVLCSGPDCHKEFPQRKYNHCIPVDTKAIMNLDYDLAQEDRMRFLSLASVMMTLWSSNAFASLDDIKDTFPGANHPRGVFKYEGPAPGGVASGRYIPHNPAPMWQRVMVFAPSIKMIRVPLVVSTIPAYFWIRRHFNNAP